MTTKPPFLLDKPQPQVKQRLYNGRKLMVWEGKVKVSSITGWVDNPRIELAKKKLTHKIGARNLTQDEISDLMKNDPEVKLNELRDDIIKNGLREPLTISYSGKLLDGNRRLFAIKHALEAMPASDPNRLDFVSVDAYILTEDATEADEQNVLVEENFSASLKIEWPDYVKAMKVIEASKKGLSEDEISQKFSWKKTKIRETLKIDVIINDFISFAVAAIDPNDESGGGLGLSEQEAETVAAKNYQYFNEAQKSFYDPLKTDYEFKFQFFRWIYENKFASFLEVRIAYQAWKNPEARAAIMQKLPTAAKSAKAILDYNTRVVQSSEEAAGRIDSFVKFLHDLKINDIKRIPVSSRENLERALQLVVKMSKAVTE